MSIEDVVQKLKSELSDKLKLLNENNAIWKQTIDHIDQEIGKIKYTHQNLCMQVDNYADMMIGQINKQREEIKHSMERNDDQYLNELQECRNDAIKNIAENDTQRSELDETLQTDNLAVLKGIADNYSICVHDPILPVNNFPKYDLQMDKDFDPSNFMFLKIEFDQVMHTPLVNDTIHKSIHKDGQSSDTVSEQTEVHKQNIKDIELDFTLLNNAAFKVKNECDAVESISRICKVNGNIWQTQYTDNSIAVYSEELTRLGVVKHHELYKPEGLTATDMSKVIVACENGLHEINDDHSYGAKISDGKYSDVTYNNQKLYALKDEPKYVEVFTLRNGNLELTQSIDIQQVQYTPYVSFN
jgi:hypothetical protein